MTSQFHTGYKYDASWKNNPRLTWVSRGRTNDEAYCSYCNCYIVIKREGMDALDGHADLETHQFIMNYKLDGRISGRDSFSSKTDLTQRAEILWCLHVAASGYPYHTANISDLFGAMFVDSKIAKNVVLGRSKIKYEINDGLYPYILEQSLRPILEHGTLYVLYYEESITEARRRVLDIYVRFWHELANKVANVLIDSSVIQRYDSEDALEKCLKALKSANLPLKKLAQVTCHISGGDLLVYRGLNAEVINDGGIPMFELKPFNENVIYDAYYKMMSAVSDWGLEDLVYDLRVWFSTCNEPDLPFQSLVDVFSNEGVGAQSIKHSKSGATASYEINDALMYRTTLGLSRSFANILANWPCLVKYFQNYVPSMERGVKKNPRYKRLNLAVTAPITLLKVTFVKNIGQKLEEFMENSLGNEGPSIFLLSSAVSRLVKDIGACFLTKEPRADAVSGIAHIKYEEPAFQLPNDKISLGAPMGALFREIPADQIRAFYADVRVAYAVLFGTLIDTLPITDPVIRGARCLTPEWRTDKDLYTAMKQLVASLHSIVHVPTVNKIMDEWDTYQTCEIEEISSNETPEEYWGRVFKMTGLGGVQKFGMMARMIQVLLCTYYRPPTVTRTLKQAEHRHTTSVANEFVKLFCGGRVSDLPFSDKVLEAYQTGWEKYEAHYSQKGLFKQANNAVAGSAAAVGGDVTRAGFHGVKEAEFLCFEGCKRIKQGLDNSNHLEVNGGIALIEEGRSKLRVVRLKMTHKEYLRELDQYNRQLALGLHRLIIAQEQGRSDDAREALAILERGQEGLCDLRMDLRPGTSREVVTDPEPEEECSSGCLG